MSSTVATVENRKDSTNHNTVHNANISVNKIYFQIAFYGDIISQLLVSSLVKVPKKNSTQYFFFELYSQVKSSSIVIITKRKLQLLL